MSDCTRFAATRRTLIVGSLLSAAGFVYSPLVLRVRAQDKAGTLPASKELAALESRAVAAGLAGEGAGRSAAASPQDAESYSELLPRLLDLLERTSTGRAAGEAISDDASPSFCRPGPRTHRVLPSRRRMPIVALGLPCFLPSPG